MAEQAKVRSIEVLRAFKAAMKEFDDSVRQALGEAQSEVQRAVGWLQSDRVVYWKQQLKVRQLRLADAKSELMRAEIATATRTSATVERKNVEKWKRAVEEAEQKIQNVRKWMRLIEREVALFRAGCQPLARIVEGDFPKAYATLDRRYEALEKYIRLTAPAGDRAVAPPSGGDAGAEIDGDVASGPGSTSGGSSGGGSGGGG